MDRGSKRKAPVPASPAVDARAAKRQKTPLPPVTKPSSSTTASTKPITAASKRDGKASDVPETPQRTSEIGVRFIEQMKAARDKTGRLISTAFLTLPDKKTMPEYYAVTALPIAIDTIEAKIAAQAYPNLTTIESDVKRMVNNAKAFNENGSEVYMDAERLRKMTSNYMVRTNPAYKDPSYVAFATPLPTGDEGVGLVTGIGTATATATSTTTGKIVLKTTDKDVVTEKVPPTPAVKRSASIIVVNERKEDGDAEGTDGDAGGVDTYEGKTFQAAQELLIEQMIKFKGDEGYEIFQPFVNLPARTLTDYYAVIKNPMSLKGIQKKIRGFHGRNETTGVSDFKSWDAMEAEMGKIWSNAKAYNEDGSDISVLADELKQAFEVGLAEAKQHVEEPTQPTLKLKMPAGPAPIKLKLGARKVSPAPVEEKKAAASPAPVSVPAVSVDQAALQRQKELVQAATSGKGVAKLPPVQDPAPKVSPEVTAKPPLVARTISQTALPSTSTAVQPEVGKAQIPTVNGAHATSAGGQSNGVSQATSTIMRPPLPADAASRIPSQSPVPTQTPAPTQTYMQNHAPPAGFDSKWRRDGKDASEALLKSIIISTPPNLQRPFRFNVTPHPSLAVQSVVLNLPSTHHYLQLEPTLSTALSLGSRAYKLFVTVNGVRVQPTSISIGRPMEIGKTQFDVKLLPGMNRVEVECGSPNGKAPPVGQMVNRNEHLDIERVTVFVHLLRG